MSEYDKYYHRMPDGTIKQISPFNGTEVWCVEERNRGPAINPPPSEPTPIERKSPENYCHFCESEYYNCTPEKARVYKDQNGEWKKVYRISPAEMSQSAADFRRVGNLFEIVTYNYWAKNYHYMMTPENRAWKEQYLSSPEGFQHAMNVLRLKMSRMGRNIELLSIDEQLERTNPFFAGCHELVIGRRHYTDTARYAHELCSSGDLTEEEHFQYMKLTVESIRDIYEQNPFVRYISVFQNWLRPAGASFDHLHRQLVGLDEWGIQLEREAAELQKNSNLYNEFAVNFAVYNSLLIAENDYAVALVEIGHRYPTIAVYSKSEKGRPYEQSMEELKGMSDLVHCIHSIITNQTTCNEEWYYTPSDSIYNMPWRILIKMRVNTTAGFEGNTKIYINPVSPHILASQILAALKMKRDKGHLCDGIRIGKDIRIKPNSLQYYKNFNLERF